MTKNKGQGNRAMEKNDVILEMKDLSVAYGRNTLLKDINIEVRAGEFWFFLGPNGVGKTTLLKVILGMMRPQGGRVLFHPEFANRNVIGFVPQRCDLNPTLPTTVNEFVLTGLAGIRPNKNDRYMRLSMALEKMDLQDLGKKSYWALSGGQRQRALIARALIRRPKFLIADEPTKDLDLSAANGLMEALTDLNRKENLTILFVTHDLTLAARYCTHTALFIDGLVRTGACHLILNAEDLEKAYGVPVAICREEETAGSFTLRINRHGG
jgi:ABC-type Mn2+/Zn2+ transport system ATPase subunit